ncbi:hypothetical protein [Methylobacterium thuringiense]|uniref:Uncharacterized protein n=1 Tax=Methylobacterium thuringiense TaxID=1003091 RepID=A0ABQ4TSW9_9HYPH|nr:hypothetical protein [Methylobacterium thuringiense]GJE57762.1 hypothetical protein EKPJFOCH_4280 [Methylobacterium thuringiense]
MNRFWAAIAIGAIMIVPASSQPYGGRDYDRDGREDGYRQRDRGYDDRDDDNRDRRRSGYGFDEGEYLRCNPDVRRAVRNGTMESGAVHYRVFGRREGRRLSC